METRSTAQSVLLDAGTCTCELKAPQITLSSPRTITQANNSYPLVKGIPIERINTHSLRSGGTNALALSGYSDTQIQKMGRWRGATFKEYVWNKLACFSSGMSRDMKTKFGFVNVSGNAFSDITDACINADYFAPLTVAVM